MNPLSPFPRVPPPPTPRLVEDRADQAPKPIVLTARSACPNCGGSLRDAIPEKAPSKHALKCRVCENLYVEI